MFQSRFNYVAVMLGLRFSYVKVTLQLHYGYIRVAVGSRLRDGYVAVTLKITRRSLAPYSISCDRCHAVSKLRFRS